MYANLKLVLAASIVRANLRLVLVASIVCANLRLVLVASIVCANLELVLVASIVRANLQLVAVACCLSGVWLSSVGVSRSPTAWQHGHWPRMRRLGKWRAGHDLQFPGDATRCRPRSPNLYHRCLDAIRNLGPFHRCLGFSFG